MKPNCSLKHTLSVQRVYLRSESEQVFSPFSVLFSYVSPHDQATTSLVQHGIYLIPILHFQLHPKLKKLKPEARKKNKRKKERAITQQHSKNYSFFTKKKLLPHLESDLHAVDVHQTRRQWSWNLQTVGHNKQSWACATGCCAWFWKTPHSHPRIIIKKYH